jgi:hypothetical protein
MNQQKGTTYEKYIKNFLQNKNNETWLWNEIPELQLRNSGLLGDWNIHRIARKENKKLTGLTAKNSFLRGIALGYVTKINLNKNQISKSSDLILISKNLELKKSIAYPRLHASGSALPKNNQDARALGQKMGQQLSIRPGLSSFTSKIFLLN